MALRCLIVEDSAFMREIFHRALSHHPSIEIVAEALDGVQALKMIEEVKPDILFLDLVLPLKNGFEVLEQVALLSPQTRTLVVSSLDDEAFISKAKALGALEYIKKPFTKADLMNAIELVSQTYAEVQNG